MRARVKADCLNWYFGMRQNREGTLSLQRYTCGTSHRLSELRKQPLGEVPSEETEDVHAGRIRESSVLGILRTHDKLLWVAYMVMAVGPGFWLSPYRRCLTAMDMQATNLMNAGLRVLLYMTCKGASIT